MPAKRPSEGEEDSLALALQTDVEAVRAVACQLCDQRRAPLNRYVPQDRVLVVRLLLVAEVDARDAAVEHAAREDRDGQMRRLLLAARPGHGTRLERDDLPAAVAVLVPAAREAAEAARLRRPAVVIKVGEAAARIGPPRLDQRIRHWLRVAVVHHPPDADCAGRIRVDGVGPAVPREPDREVRPDRLRRRRAEDQNVSSNGVWPGPRR